MLNGATVLKIGGAMLADGERVQRFAEAVALRGAPLVVVHGGGPQLSAAQRLMGDEAEWRDGLRVTSEAAMKAASWVLSGEVNKRIVGALLDHGVDAIGLSGEDGALLRARLSPAVPLSRTGEVAGVRAPLIRVLLEQGLTLVVSPVSRGPDGQPVNVNADMVAVAVARALRSSELLFITDVAGVRGERGTLSRIDGREAEKLIATGTAEGGMAPKLRAAAAAAAGGVGSVRIGMLEMLTSARAGTRVLPPSASSAAMPDLVPEPAT